jgi:hypothetical protein
MPVAGRHSESASKSAIAVESEERRAIVTTLTLDA